MRFHRFVLCVTTIIISAPAFGNNIVTNGTFASPVVGTFNGTGSVSQNGDTMITQWGVNGPSAGVFADPSAPSGFQGAYIDVGTTVYQDVGVLLPNTIYTLNLFSQQTGDQPAQVAQLTEALATGLGGGQNSVVNTGSLAIGNQASVIPASSFAPVSPLTYTTGSTVSGDLFVLLTDTAAGSGSGRTPQLYVDDVTLSTAPVPEPSTTLFLAVSSLSMVGYRLVRRRLRQ